VAAARQSPNGFRPGRCKPLSGGVKLLSFNRYRFPAHVIRYGVWRYFRFSLSFRGVAELLA
jgi:hypothetical protein